MKLLEFFGEIKNFENQEKNLDDRKMTGEDLKDEKLADEVYWFILDHDRIHKEHFMPVASEMYRLKDSKKFDKEKFAEKFLPLVNKGCMEYYKEMKLEDDPNDLFTKAMRKDLCQRLNDQCYDDILKDEYKFGDDK